MPPLLEEKTGEEEREDVEPQGDEMMLHFELRGRVYTSVCAPASVIVLMRFQD